MRSDAYRNKGIGRILERKTVFGETFCDVYFRQTKETFRLQIADLKPVKSPLEALETGEFCRPEEFLLLLVSRQINSYLTQQGLITPNNFRIIPLPHQLISVNFVIEHFKPRCLFADEVGLEKQ